MEAGRGGAAGDSRSPTGAVVLPSGQKNLFIKPLAPPPTSFKKEVFQHLLMSASSPHPRGLCEPQAPQLCSFSCPEHGQEAGVSCRAQGAARGLGARGGSVPSLASLLLQELAHERPHGSTLPPAPNHPKMRGLAAKFRALQ